MNISKPGGDGLTPHEKGLREREVLAELRKWITYTDVKRAIPLVLETVEARYEEGRERQPGFAIVVAKRATVINLLNRYDNTRWRDHRLRRGATGFWRELDQRADKEVAGSCTDDDARAAFKQAMIASPTGAPSGTIDTGFLRQTGVFSDEELRHNVPGAILVDDLVFSVAGLEPANSREAATAIVAGAFEIVHERVFGRELSTGLLPGLEE
jgi:hypothetical protein